MNGQSEVLQVLVLRDGVPVRSEMFTPGSYAIGSGGAVDLHLEDGSVSPSHAVLYFQNGRVAVQDSGSQIGTYVNGRKVEACELRPSDELALGAFVLRLRVLASAVTSQAKPPPAIQAMLEQPPARVAAVSAPPPRAAPGPRPPPPAAVRVGGGRGSSAALARSAPAPLLAEDEPITVPGYDRGLDSLEALLDRPAPSQPPKPRPTAVKRPTRTGSAPGAGLKAAMSRTKTVRGKPRLYVELYWGQDRREVRSFTHVSKGGRVLAAAEETSPFPLWGFSLPHEPFILAEPESRPKNRGFRVYLPPKVETELYLGEQFEPLEPESLQKEGSAQYVTLENGTAVRFTEGEMTLLAYVAPPPEKVWANPFKGMPLLLCFLFALFGGGFYYFLSQVPKRAEFEAKAPNLPSVAVRLLAPQPKKKELAQKKLEKIKEEAAKHEEKAEKRAEKRPEKREKKEAPAPAPASKALQALAKLNAGPASKSIFNAMDKLGAPAAKSNNYKLSGLIGKPVANLGLGAVGVALGKGGGGTMGSELLHGKGGAGIGALGLGGVGRGSVGGTVTRATARSVSVQGSIDREAVAKVVNSHLQEVRACYEKALLKDPGLAGKVVLEWTISTSGGVTTAKTKSSTLRNSAVESCIMRELKGWSFPAAKGGMVIVSYPFLFNSVGY